MRSFSYILLILLVLLASCSEFDKLMKSSDYDLKKAKAREYFEAGKYARATELLAQLLPRFRGTEEAEDLNWMNAQSFYLMKDYYSAGAYFKGYTDQYPFGKYTEEAYFMGAFCDYKISPRAALDQENTRNAIEGFNIFMNRYPYSSRIEECKTYLREIEERLVEKSYLSAKLYYDMKEYKAAVTALTNSLRLHSSSRYREEMMFLKLNSLYMYAENSFAFRQKERFQATLDDYYSFMEEFPDSKYGKDVRRIFQKTNEYLKTGTTEAAESVANNQ